MGADGRAGGQCPSLQGTAPDAGRNIWAGRECLHRATGAVVAALEVMLLAMGLLS